MCVTVMHVVPSRPTAGADGLLSPSPALPATGAADEDFHAAAISSEKDEDVAKVGIALEGGTDHAGERVDPTAHVDGRSRDEDPAIREIQHRSARTTVGSVCSTRAAGIWTLMPFP